jgi:hypothetical protein
MSTFPFGSFPKNANLETVYGTATPLNMVAANNFANMTIAGNVFLPALVTLSDGAIIWVKNTSGGSVTVNPFAGDAVIPSGYTTLAAGNAALYAVYKSPTPSVAPIWVGLIKQN